MFDNLGVSLPLVASGKLKLLAVASAHWLPALPDVPTIAATLPGFEVVAWYGIVEDPSKHCRQDQCRCERGSPRNINNRSASASLLHRPQLTLASTANPSPLTRPASMHAPPSPRTAPQDIAVTEAAVAIDREGRVVGYFVLEVETAEPAIGR